MGKFAQLPGTKHLVLIFISILGIIVHLQDLTKTLKSKSGDR